MIYCAITYVNNCLMSLVPGSCGDLDVLFRQGILPEVVARNPRRAVLQVPAVFLITDPDPDPGPGLA